MERREVITAMAAGVAAGMLPGAAGAKAGAAFPAGFLWGTAGAAYQVEGNNIASDLWVVEHLKTGFFKDPSGDACDVYHRYGEDLDLVARNGFNCHRLGIEWARIEPERGQVSLAQIAYYRRVLEGCVRRGLKPVVTFCHFTVPRWVAASGGFADPANVEAFAAHCARLAVAMGDLIHLAATFNEPNLATVVRWTGQSAKYRPLVEAVQKAAGLSQNAPGWRSPMLSGETQYDGIIAAHSRAIEAVRKAGGRFPMGFTLALPSDSAANGDDTALKRKQAELMDRWLAAPGDFIGVQTYTGSPVGPDGDLPPPAGTEVTQMGYPFTPDAIEGAIRMVAARWKKPIYVTENGVATEDDSRRIAYIDGAIAGVRRVLASGIDLRGYIHWSLLDNWEWMSGYGPKFGLVAVDRKTFRRTPKPSFAHLGAIARRGGMA